MIVGVQATAARMSQETVAAQDMLTRFAEWQGRAPESVAADTTYGNGEFLQWLADRSITPYMKPVIRASRVLRSTSPKRMGVSAETSPGSTHKAISRAIST